jgi:hypothetical protein
MGIGFKCLKNIGVEAVPNPSFATVNSERVQADLSRAKAQGKTLGRPKAAIRPERVLSLREKGLSLRAIAAETGSAQ